MKRYALSVMGVAAAAVLLAGAERGGGAVRVEPIRGGGGSQEGGGQVESGRGGGAVSRPSAPPVSRSAGPSPVYRQQRVTVPRASMPRPERTIRDDARPVYPRRDESGKPIMKRPSAVPPARHSAVVGDTNVVRNIQTQQRVEVVPGRYYWHDDRGLQYSHYYDGRYHWYGFYDGPTFYWTRYYGERWWWYDPLRLRWNFWWDGFWWWPGPGGVPYVYVDNSYYPYEDSGVTVERVTEQPAPSELPDAGSGTTVNSPDGKRMIQIFGAEGQAFLYDKSSNPPTFLRYLGQGVARVRFSNSAGAAQLLVEYKDDTFALFDQDGNSRRSEVKTEESTAPPERPESIPPPPTSAPGR